MRTIQYSAALVGFAFLLFIALASFAFAQTSEGVTIRPGVIEERVEPGSSYDFTVRVTNDSDNEKTFYLATQNIQGMNDQGLPVFAGDGEETPYELSAWVDLPDGSMTFAPRETKEVSFSVHVPENASPGGHFGGIFLDAQPPRLRTVGAGIAMRVGSIMNLRVAGEAHEEARLREFSTDRLIYDASDVSFLLRVENLGNVLLRPHGFIDITDMGGREVARISVNDSAAAVFPVEEKQFTLQWDPEGISFGRYQATLALAYGEDARRSITGSTAFWVLPFKPIAIALGSLLAIVLIFYLLIKMHIRKKLREMGASSRSGRADAALYARKYQGPVSRLTIVVLSVMSFTFLFLVGLFFLFA